MGAAVPAGQTLLSGAQGRLAPGREGFSPDTTALMYRPRPAPRSKHQRVNATTRSTTSSTVRPMVSNRPLSGPPIIDRRRYVIGPQDRFRGTTATARRPPRRQRSRAPCHACTQLLPFLPPAFPRCSAVASRHGRARVGRRGVVGGHRVPVRVEQRPRVARSRTGARRVRGRTRADGPARATAALAARPARRRRRLRHASGRTRARRGRVRRTDPRVRRADRPAARRRVHAPEDPRGATGPARRS